jgi:hypothetical protein
MDTFIYVVIAGIIAWNACLAVRLYRIETYLAESELCDDCRGKEAATVSAAESADDDF